MKPNNHHATILQPERIIPKYVIREEEFFLSRVQKEWNGNHIMHGRIPNENSIILMSNDYLSLANHPDILKAQSDTLMQNGNGLLMSGIFLHGENPQADFEKRMAALLKTEQAVLCQSGWCANVGLLQAISDENTPVYIDMRAHMSLWEGIKSAGAKAYHFYHNDMDHLEKQIKRYGEGVIVVDSIYSTHGSICPLKDLTEVGNMNNCVIVVDESHSLGTHGKHGEGLVASLGLSDKVHFITASLAKAFAGRAGIITCSNRFADYFKFTSLPAIFSSTLLPHEIAGLQKTLDIIIGAKERREKLHFNSKYLNNHLFGLGYNVNISQSQIIPLEAGPEKQTIILRDALEARDIFGAVFCAPATSKNRSMIRLSIKSELRQDDLDYIIEVCNEIRKEVSLSSWPSTKRLRNKPVYMHEQ